MGTTLITSAALFAEAVSVTVWVELNGKSVGLVLPPTKTQEPTGTTVVPGTPETLKVKLVPTGGAAGSAALQIFSGEGSPASSV